MRKILALILAMTMSLSLVSCGGKKTTESNWNIKILNENGEDIIKFGVFEPQTGPNGPGAIKEVYGIRFANMLYNTINIKGKEYKIVLDEVDNKSDKAEAPVAADKLISDKVAVVLGSYGSGVSIAAGGKFKNSKLPAIGCSCTNPQVTLGNEYYFRTCFLDSMQGRAMAAYAKSKGYDKVAVITESGDDYSEGLGIFFEEGCKEKGIEVVDHERFQTNEQSFTAYLTNIKGKEPQFIYAPTSITSAPLILKQARELGITCQIGAGDTWDDGDLTYNGGNAADGAILTTFYAADPNKAEGEEKVFLNGRDNIPGFLEYLHTYSSVDKSIPAVSALGYDAYLAAYKAIEKAQSTDGEDIRKALVNLEFTGVTGKIAFDLNGDVAKDEAFIKEVQNGEFVSLGTQQK